MGLEERTRARRASARASACARRLAQMVGIGVIASVARHRRRPADRLVPRRRLRRGEADRHAVGRPDHLLRPRLRRGHGRRAVLGLEVPHAAGRGAPRRAADPRQHAPGGHLDRDPGDPARRPVHLRLRRARGRRGGRGQHDAGARRRRAVRLDVLLPRRTARRSPRTQLHLPINRPVKFTLQSKDVLHDFWVPGLPHEEGRGARDRRQLPRHARTGSAPTRSSAPSCAASATRSMRSTAHVVERARSSTTWLGDARQAGRGRRPAAAAAAAPRADGKAIFTSSEAAAAAATRWPTPATSGTVGPDLDKVLKGKDAAFIKQSIVDPTR